MGTTGVPLTARSGGSCCLDGLVTRRERPGLDRLVALECPHDRELLRHRDAAAPTASGDAHHDEHVVLAELADLLDFLAVLRPGLARIRDPLHRALEALEDRAVPHVVELEVR